MQRTKTKALALLSGGLDSHLAIKVVQEQGVEVEALNFITTFCTCTGRNGCQHEASKAAASLSVPITVLNYTEELIEAVRHPKYGYGSHVNPCIDCRINMFKKAKEHMEATGADLIITGEVLGSRPMSQNLNSLRLIEKESGLKGKILRPLSARHLEPTDVEKSGAIDREQLLAIHGRSRSEQFLLATALEIGDYPCPSGGCLLTDPGFSLRFEDLLAGERESFTLTDVKLLKYGRHYRVNKKTKIIVGRNESENKKLKMIVGPGDILLECIGFEGPTTVVRSAFDIAGTGDGTALPQEAAEQILKVAAELTASYGQGRKEPTVKVRVFRSSGGTIATIEAETGKRDQHQKFMLTQESAGTSPRTKPTAS